MARVRLTADVEPGALQAARAAVSEGWAENVGAWVNEALVRQAEHDQRMRATDELLGAHQAEHGEISDQDIAESRHRLRSRAVVVRGRPA